MHRTCDTCLHWQRHAWPNGRGWHPHGTCATLQLMGSAFLLGNRPPLEPTPLGRLLTTQATFGCNRWQGQGQPDKPRISIRETDSEEYGPELVHPWFRTFARYTCACGWTARKGWHSSAPTWSDTYKSSRAAAEEELRAHLDTPPHASGGSAHDQ